MRRGFVSWIMLFALLCHTMAGAALGVVSGVQQDEHAALHWLEEGHHHGDDGGVHADDSAASWQHLMADGCSHATCLLPTLANTPLPSGSQALPQASTVGLPSPHLGAPRRPPRAGH